MENLNTDDLMKLQVEQLEKEKKDLHQRLRIVAKRVDHIERAYRKEERPLLGQDYEEQQANDRATFESLQKSRVEGSRISHQHDVETKKRLSRMMVEYQSRRATIIAKRGDEYARRQAAAARKIEEEKAKRRKAVLQEREQERLRIEEEERIRRDREEEEASLEAGMYLIESVLHDGTNNSFIERIAEEQRLREEEEAVLAAAEAAKREAEAKAVAMRKQREEERAAAAEAARLQRQREEEAEKRREQRKAEERAAARNPVASRVANGEAPAAWRRTSPANTAAATPRAQAATPPRSESPKFRPSVVGGGGGSAWRDREARKSAGGVATAAPLRPASPAVTPRPVREELPKDDDGFQQPAKVWKPKRLQGR
jgi:translation initiation factor 3 subunit A